MRTRTSERKSADVYWKDKLKYHFQKMRYEIERLEDLGIDVDIDAMCAELKRLTGKVDAWVANKTIAVNAIGQ